VVSSACLELPDTSTAETFTAPLPAEACTNFGPLTSKPAPARPTPTPPAATTSRCARRLEPASVRKLAADATH
jgi:hypothetical protein